MGNRFREEIFARLRPRLRIHGNRREGFYFTPKVAPVCLGWWAFVHQGRALVSWDTVSAREAGFTMFGDAEYRVWRFDGQYSTWSSFAADALWHAHDWYSAAPWNRFNVRVTHPRSAREKWPAILRRCSDHRHRTRIFQSANPPTIKSIFPLVDGGNGTVLLLRCSGGYAVSEFYTS